MAGGGQGLADQMALTAAARASARRHATADALVYAIRRLLGVRYMDDVKHAEAVVIVEQALASEARRSAYRRQVERGRAAAASRKK